ncbi:MAG: ABC transporter ATP-binding protein [Clostridiales bacterium]|nr:ABC transporter ATP-binding protein [Clostridiales bacterium]
MQKAKKLPDNALATVKRIIDYMGNYRYRLIIVVFFVLLSAMTSILGTYFLKPLINDYILPFVGQENPDLSLLGSGLAKMGIIYLIGALSTYIYNRLMVDITAGTLHRIRTDLFAHMQTLPIKYFDTHTHGELMSRYTNDIDALRNMLSQSYVQIINSGVTIIGVFIAMLLLSPALTLLVIVMLVLMLSAVKAIGKGSRKYSMAQQASLGDMNGYIEEMMEGQKVIKVFNYEDKAKEAFDKKNETLFKQSQAAQTYTSVLRPIMGNLGYALYAITAMAGAFISVTRGLDIGSLASFLQYTRTFSQPITIISEQFNSIIIAIAGAERVFQVIDENSEVDEGSVTLVHAKEGMDNQIIESNDKNDPQYWKQVSDKGEVTYTKVQGDIQFVDVVFAYDEEKTVLRNINLFAKPGQKVAFVGSTGAGKTTITNLINRFYDIKEGTIFYDGIDIKNIKKDDLRSTLSLVLQDTHLFSGTIMENIRYGNLAASNEEVIAAAKLANADSFIRHLPKGYDTFITGDGENLSQGQRQLLAIARAAVADPHVLILDEATSSIDTRTESLIGKGMEKLMEGRTTLVIAHRLSTIQNSDVILVIEGGEIIERGDHDKLIEEQGKYYQLYTGMFELS